MRVNHSLLSRCRKCLDMGGQHFQHFLSQGTLFSLFIIMHEQSENSAVQLIFTTCSYFSCKPGHRLRETQCIFVCVYMYRAISLTMNHTYGKILMYCKFVNLMFSNMEGRQSGTYLRTTRASSGPRVSIAKTYRDETKLK